MEQLAADLWGVSDRLRLPGGIIFPLRMTVVRLPDGGLWLHSPVSIDDATASAIEALGPVQHIVAPNLLHTLHLASAQARWPDAVLYAPRGLADQEPDLRVDHALEELAPGAWQGAIEWRQVRGAPTVDETVFFHRATGSLLVTDLVFNFEGANLGTRTLLRIVGCHHRMAASRSWGWVFAKDRAAIGSSVSELLAWPIERVIPCHGAVVTADAHPAFTAAVARLTAWDRAPSG